MRCLIIHGSPNQTISQHGAYMRGYTASLVARIKLTMQVLDKSVEFDEVALRHAGIPHCRGCYACFYEGEEMCPHQSRVQPIIEKMLAADCLILTSPVYALQVSGLVKGFFDHGAYLYHRPRFFDKHALVISTTMGGGAKDTCDYMRETLMHWGYNRVYSIDFARRGIMDIPPDFMQDCRKTVRKFVESVQEKQYTSPSFRRLFFYAIWRAMADNEGTPEVDKQYWKQTGLKYHVFSPYIRVGRFKTFVGNLMYRLAGRMVKPKATPKDSSPKDGLPKDGLPE